MNVQRTRRTGRRKTGHEMPIRPATYRNLINPFPSQPLYSDDQIDHIHNLAKQILQEIGIRALLPGLVTPIARQDASWMMTP